MSRIAIVSDTHGLLRPEVLERLGGAERILHVGDVCGEHVLDGLRAIAPVFSKLMLWNAFMESRRYKFSGNTAADRCIIHNPF